MSAGYIVSGGPDGQYLPVAVFTSRELAINWIMDGEWCVAYQAEPERSFFEGGFDVYFLRRRADYGLVEKTFPTRRLAMQWLKGRIAEVDAGKTRIDFRYPGNYYISEVPLNPVIDCDERAA